MHPADQFEAAYYAEHGRFPSIREVWEAAQAVEALKRSDIGGGVMDIIEIARECGAEIFSGAWCDPDIRVYYFWQFELEGFAQRIEQPLKQRIDELEKDCEILQTNLDAALMQVKQLRNALHTCKGWVEAYGQPETREM